MTTEPIIQVKNLKKSFGSLQVLKGINTEVEKGEKLPTPSAILTCTGKRWAWCSSTLICLTI